MRIPPRALGRGLTHTWRFKCHEKPNWLQFGPTVKPNVSRRSSRKFTPQKKRRGQTSKGVCVFVSSCVLLRVFVASTARVCVFSIFVHERSHLPLY